MDPKKTSKDKKKLLEESESSIIEEDSGIGQQGKGKKKLEGEEQKNVEGEEEEEEEEYEEEEEDDDEYEYEYEDEEEGKEGALNKPGKEGKSEKFQPKTEEQEEEEEGEGEERRLTKRQTVRLRAETEDQDGEESPYDETDEEQDLDNDEDEEDYSFGDGSEEDEDEEDEDDDDEGEGDEDQEGDEDEEDLGPSAEDEGIFKFNTGEPENRIPRGGTIINIDDGSVVFSNILHARPTEIFGAAGDQKPGVKSVRAPQDFTQQDHIKNIVKAHTSTALNPLKRTNVSKKNPEVDDEETHLQNEVMGRAKVVEAVNKRKKMRYIAYFSYLILIGVILAVTFNFLMIKGTMSSSSNPNITLSIDNCTLYILDNTDSSTAPVYAKYQVPTQLVPNPATTVTSSSSGTLQELTVLNGVNPDYCLIELYIQPNFALNSLNISCGNCNVTQDSSQLIVNGPLTVAGDVVHSNFRNVYAQTFNYQAISGYVQLNNIELSENQNNTINITNQGDIIIQSTQDFLINAHTNTQAFCFSAPGMAKNGDTDCSISNSSNTSIYHTSYPNCSISYYICSDSSCVNSSMPTFTVSSVTGNIFANWIQDVSMPVANGTPIIKGEIYNGGLGFNSDAEEALSSFDSLVSDQSKGDPFIRLDLGDLDSRSSRYNKWVVSSTPSYAYMRPWWIGTFSAGVLDGYVEQVSGFLLPGVCPFVPQYTMSDLLTIQNLITSKIKTNNTLVTFVQDQAMPMPPATPTINTGIFPLIDKGNPFDGWYSLSLAANGNIVALNNNYTVRNEILATVIVSLVIAAYCAYLLLTITFIGINIMYTKLVDFASHLDNYAILERLKSGKKEPKKKSQPVVHSQYSLSNILAHAPSPSAFIDYLSLTLYREFSSSVVQFYYLLFREVDPKKLHDQELDPTHDMMKGTDVKLLYEKFCFMNHMHEQKLTDMSNLALLKKYGFHIVTRNDLQVQVYTKMSIIKFETIRINPNKEDQNTTSLDLYIKENVKLTQFDEDQVEVDTFMKLYNDFCDCNRLTKIVVNPSLMKDKYDINFNVVPQQTIMRIPVEEDHFLPNYEKGCLHKVTQWWKRGDHPEKVYVFDTSKLENHFNLVMHKFHSMTTDQLELATLDLILYPTWRLWDAITVFFHLFIGAVITIPLIGLVMLNEDQYKPWSVKNQLDLISFQDILYDPAQLAINLYNSFIWNEVFMILVTLLWVISFFDLLLYYAVMEFPQDKSFKKSENQSNEGFWHKKSRQLEWVLVFFALAFYFGYIGLFLTWLLLGAFVNPNSFLPFASAAVTFVTFVVVKYTSFKDLAKQGSKAVMVYVQKIFGGFINGVLGKITQNLQKVTTNFTQGKMKEILQSGAFQTVTGKLEEAGIVDPSTIAQYSQKLEHLNAKTLVNDAVAVAKDPSILAKEVGSVEQALKEKTIEKIKDECAKRRIPPKIVDLVIAICAKSGNDKIKDILKQVILDVNTQLKLPSEGADIVIELLYPTGVDKEETVMFITSKIVNLIFELANLSKNKGLTPGLIINIFNIFRNVEEKKYDAFMKDIKNLVGRIKVIPVTDAKLLMPALDIIAVLAKEKPDHWNIKAPCLQLLSSGASLMTETDSNQKKAVEDVQEFVKFLPLVFTNTEAAYHIEKKEALSPQEILKIIKTFCAAIGINQTVVGNITGGDKFLTSFIYFAIFFIKQETHDIPSEVIKGLQEGLRVKISDFFPSTMHLTNVIYNKPKTVFQRLNTSANTFRLNSDIQNFLKVLGFYTLYNFQTYYPTINLEKTPYFAKIAQALKADADELVGLIDVLYCKNNSNYLNAFLEAAFARTTLKKDKFNTIRSLFNLLLSDDEITLVQTMNDLNLDHIQFMLVGKQQLNPKFIPQSQFDALGVTERNLLSQKDKIFYDTPEKYNNWKIEIQKDISDNLTKMKNLMNPTATATASKKASTAPMNPFGTAVKPMSPEDFEKYEHQANLVKAYLRDWKNCKFTQKDLTQIITALDNVDNQLKKNLIEVADGENASAVEFLASIMEVARLRLENGKRYPQLNKEKLASIETLSKCLSINYEGLKNFLQLFVISDLKTLLPSYYYFFPDDKEIEDSIKKVMTYSFRQAGMALKQFEFLSETLPNNTRLPGSWFKKIYYESSDIDYKVKDMLELASYLINKLTPAQEKRDSLLTETYAFGMFAKGLLPKDSVSSLLEIQDPKIVGFIHALLDPNIDNRHTMLTALFPMKNHPIKDALAFAGLLTGRKFNIGHNPKLVIPGEVPDQESIRTYLGNLLNIRPEVFDLFDIIFERDITKFLPKALPIIRRINKSSIVNMTLMESLLSLSLAEHFNPNDLASKLSISPDIIDFFVSLMRIMNKPTRKKEFKDLSNLVSFSKVLTKLKVKPNEFISLVKVMFNIFEGDEGVMEIFNNLNLNPKIADPQNKAPKDKINIDLFRNLITVNRPTDPKLDMFKNKAYLNILKTKTASLFNVLGLSKNYDNAYIISRLAAGNFLILNDYKEQLSWAFPTHDSTAETAILHLTMALSGILNSNVSLYPELDSEIRSFVDNFYPKQSFSFQEKVYKTKDKLLPNNSLAYAIYLTYETLDITPQWIQAFMFDQNAYTKITNAIPDLKPEFILAIVLNFIFIPDIMGDFFGLYEWTTALMKFYKQSTGKTVEDTQSAMFKAQMTSAYSYFEEKLPFDYQRVKDFANITGIIQESYWSKLLAKPENFNSKVNQSLLYILTLKLPIEEKKELGLKVKGNFKDAPNAFLKTLASVLRKEGSFTDLDETPGVVGRMIRQAITRTYETINEKFYQNASRYPGYALTDLCMLGAISLLRNRSDISKQRKIYNLHQIAMNIERKMFFDDNFFKMSKHKLMKLAGISLNVQASNLLEFSFNGSLFSNDYATDLEMAQDEEERTKIRIKECEYYLLDPKQAQPAETKTKEEQESNEADEDSDESVDDGPRVGNLGFYGGSYKEFNDRIDEIFKAEDWDSINLLLEIDGIVICHPQDENAVHVLDLEPDEFVDLCKTKDKLTYHSPEIVTLIGDEYGLTEFSEERIRYQNPNYNPEEDDKPEENKEQDNQQLEADNVDKAEESQGEDDHEDGGYEYEYEDEDEDSASVEDEETKKKRIKLENNLVDVKTGLIYKTLKEKAIEFEKALVDPNMDLIQGVIRGEVSQLVEGSHALNQGDPDNPNAKIYMALIGLQSYTNKKSGQTDNSLLKEYLGILSNKIDSDVSKLTELLEFLVTRRSALTDTLTELDISDNIADFLLINIKEKTGLIEGEDEDEESKFSLVDTISKTLGIKFKDAVIYGLIRDIYQCKKPAWLIVVDLLRKDSPSTRTQENETHPLAEIIKLIKFPKLRKQVNLGEDTQIIHSFTMEFKDQNDYMTYILREIILKYCNYNLTPEETNLLTEQHYITRLLLQLNYQRVFEKLIIGAADQDLGQSDDPLEKTMLGTILKTFGVSSTSISLDNDMRLVRLFFALVHGDLSAFKTRSSYDTTVQSIIDDMVQVQILGSLKNDPTSQRILNQLLLGMASWDPQLCINAFIQAGATNEAYLLYSIYGCFNANHLFSRGGRQLAEAHLKALHPILVKPTLAKDSVPYFQSPAGAGLIKKAMNDALPNARNEDGLKEALHSKVEEIFDFTQQVKQPGYPKPRPLTHHMTKAMGKHADQNLDPEDEDEDENGGKLMNILTSTCDGSILVKMINDCVTEDKPKTLLKNLVEFMLKLQTYLTKGKAPEDVVEAFSTLLSSIEDMVDNNKELWSKIAQIAPDVLAICLYFEKAGETDVVEAKIDSIDIMKNITSSIKSDAQQGLILDLMSVMLGVDIRKFDKDKCGGRLKEDLSTEDRIEMFFNRVCQVFFPHVDGDKGTFGDWHKQIFNLIVKLRTDFMQGLKDPQKLRLAVKDVLAILQDFKIISQPLIEALLGLLDGDLSGCGDLLATLAPKIPRPMVNRMLSYLTEALNLLGFDFTSQNNASSLPLTQPGAASKLDSEDFAAIMKKIKDGTASSTDLFKMVDAEGDNSGSINLNEFQMLANRLNLTLSSHRIQEIFTKVKGDKVQAGSEELNEQEFSKALDYLQEKNLNQALTLLGVTPEILTAILIRLIILLLLIFVFIFLGISAFAIGGTFGSIINSLFPAAGGGALGKEKDADKGKLEDDKVKEATEKGFNITTSEQL